MSRTDVRANTLFPDSREGSLVCKLTFAKLNTRGPLKSSDAGWQKEVEPLFIRKNSVVQKPTAAETSVSENLSS